MTIRTAVLCINEDEARLRLEAGQVDFAVVPAKSGVTMVYVLGDKIPEAPDSLKRLPGFTSAGCCGIPGPRMDYYSCYRTPSEVIEALNA